MAERNQFCAFLRRLNAGYTRDSHHITFWQGVVSNRRKRRPLHTHARLRYCLPRGDGFFGDINNMRPTRVIEVCQAIRILWHIANSNIPVR